MQEFMNTAKGYVIVHCVKCNTAARGSAKMMDKFKKCGRCNRDLVVIYDENM